MMATPGVRIKAQWFRTQLAVLTSQGMLDVVCARVSRETAEVIANPPLSGSWMSYAHIIEICLAVESIGGLAAVRELAAKVTEVSRKPYMAITEGILKLFGTSPATLLKRINTINRTIVEGIDFTYIGTGERSCVVLIEYAAKVEFPLCAFIGPAASFPVYFDLCGVKGVVGAPERIGPNKARYKLSW
jgi:hypothetical protein